MTNSEIMKIHDAIHTGSLMLLEKLEKGARGKDIMPLCEMGELADIMKDLAYAEKCLAKAHYYMSEHSPSMY